VPQYENVISESIGVKGIVWKSTNNTGKYKFTDIDLEKDTAVPVSLDNEYPLSFAPGRVLLDLNKDAGIVVENNKNTITRSTVIEVSIEDAKTSNISEGDAITLIGTDFELAGKAHINGLQKGLVASTSLFGNLVETVASSKDPNKISNIEKLTIRKVKIVTD
jgi:predicted molibdopterin-dependent oxidoreductase YjgC